MVVQKSEIYHCRFVDFIRICCGCCGNRATATAACRTCEVKEMPSGESALEDQAYDKVGGWMLMDFDGG